MLPSLDQSHPSGELDPINIPQYENTADSMVDGVLLGGDFSSTGCWQVAMTVAKPGNSRPWLATDGIRSLVTVEPAYQHLLAIREVSPNRI